MSLPSVIKQEPRQIEPPSVQRSHRDFRSRAGYLTQKLTTKQGWFGDYDYAWLCMPTLPFAVAGKKTRRVMPPFYALDSDLPLLLALTCGLQHALAMLAGLITPPIIFASALNLDSETSAYLISASLIGCG
jgi:uric acid-xanthine permease